MIIERQRKCIAKIESFNRFFASCFCHARDFYRSLISAENTINKATGGPFMSFRTTSDIARISVIIFDYIPLLTTSVSILLHHIYYEKV